MRSKTVRDYCDDFSGNCDDHCYGVKSNITSSFPQKSTAFDL